MDVTEGAYGGMEGMDGLDAVDVLYANTKNNPIEDIEAHYPLRVERYELREDAAGDGQWRGGFGPLRDTRMLVDGFYLGRRGWVPPRALGLERREGRRVPVGSSSSRMEKPEGELLASKIDNMPVKAGTVIRDLCPCGGGFGPPESARSSCASVTALDGLVHE